MILVPMIRAMLDAMIAPLAISTGKRSSVVVNTQFNTFSPLQDVDMGDVMTGAMMTAVMMTVGSAMMTDTTMIVVMMTVGTASMIEGR